MKPDEMDAVFAALASEPRRRQAMDWTEWLAQMKAYEEQQRGK